MAKRWSFNRQKDKHLITEENFTWEGPFCLPKYETEEVPMKMPDIPSVYIFCFPYKTGFVIEAAGVTKSTKQRIATHIRTYKKGGYNIFDVDAISNLERIEIWHGWADAKLEENKKDFQDNYKFYKSAIEKQLSNYRIFYTRIENIRIRERLEAGIMINSYTSKELWANLAPRWMHLKGRYNNEIPINAKNICQYDILGLPYNIEI